MTTPPTGGVTVRDDDALPTLPRASLKRNVRLVVPTGNTVSFVASTTVASIAACGVCRAGALSPPSAAEPPPRYVRTACDAGEAATLPRAPSVCVAATVIDAGAVTTGAVVSATMTLNDAEPLLPCASTAVQATVVEPMGKIEPLAGTQVTVTTPSNASIADAVNVCGVPAGLVASIVTVAGTEICGGVVSPTVTGNDAVPVLPCLSDAVQFTVVSPIGKVAPLAGVQVTATEPSTRSTDDAL